MDDVTAGFIVADYEQRHSEREEFELMKKISSCNEMFKWLELCALKKQSKFQPPSQQPIPSKPSTKQQIQKQLSLKIIQTPETKSKTQKQSAEKIFNNLQKTTDKLVLN